MKDLVFDHFFSSIGAAVSWWFLGVLIGVGIVIFLKKKGVLSRENKVLKFFTYTYYLGIPFFIGLFTGNYGVIRNVEQEAIFSTTELISSIEKETYPAFHHYVTETFDSIPLDLTKEEFIDNFLGTQDSEGGFVENEIVSYVLDYSLDYAAEKVMTKTSEAVHLDSEIFSATVKAMANGDMDEIHHDLYLLLEDVVGSFVSSMFSPYYVTNFLIFLMAILFPVIEISISAYRKNKSKKPAN